MEILAQSHELVCDRADRAPAPAVAQPAPGAGKAESFAIRLINFLVALVAVIVLLPLFLLTALAVKLDSRGPISYGQVRVGVDRRSLGARRGGRRAIEGDGSAAEFGGDDRRELESEDGRRNENFCGRPFIIYKFRTMRVDAEDETGPVWAGVDDDRVTGVGRWLRRYRLDEIPQFWNVLKGDMSVVGPRPERPKIVADLRRSLEAYSLRQRVRPGITGLAQVSQGSDKTLDDVRTKLEFDLEYISRRSVATDLRIMLGTVPVVLWQEEEEGSSKGVHEQ